MTGAAAPEIRAATVRERLSGFITRQDPIDWAAAMTLIMVAQHVEPVWYIRHPATALAAAGLVVRGISRRAWFWAVLSAVLLLGHLRLWYAIDNHEWLLTYWCLALALGHLAQQPRHALATSGRLLVGLCFLFATAWKVELREFRDGDFFEHAALFDQRFASLPVVAGGMSRATVAANQRERARLYAVTDAPASVTLRTVPRLRTVARVMAVTTILVEGLVALCFLWPEGRGPSRIRDPVLLAFLAGVYPLASVVGFGWLLAAMGAAQARGRWPVAYVAVFALMPLYHLPFGGFVTALFGLAR